MRLSVLLENTACCDDPATGGAVSCGSPATGGAAACDSPVSGGSPSGRSLYTAHGLSFYIETKKHRILFDMGPDGGFADNAEKMGIDLKAVDLAFLSHGHDDHGGGLPAFRKLNRTAAVYVQKSAFKPYFAVKPEEAPRPIGLQDVPAVEDLTLIDGGLEIDTELRLFSRVPVIMNVRSAGSDIMLLTGEGFLPDDMRHEQHLLIREEGKLFLVIGCAHSGVVNILEEVKRTEGRWPDAVFGGFHLFGFHCEEEDKEGLVKAVSSRIAETGAVFYTGHCTGDYAYEVIEKELGDRLVRLHTGSIFQL